MNALAHLSDIVIPILIFFIVGYGFVSRVKVYETFLKGATDGLKIVVDIVPTLIGLLVAVGMLRASGFFEMLGTLLGPAAAAFGGEAVLLLRGHRAGAGRLPHIRAGFLCRDIDIHINELHRDRVLHHERVLSGGEGDEDPVHPGRSAAGYPGGDGDECGSGRVDVVSEVL